MDQRTSKFQLWTVLAKILLSTSLIAPVKSQEGFVSIDCGGEGGQDPVTPFVWVTDAKYLDSIEELQSEGVVIAANVTYDNVNVTATSQDNWEQLQTAMVFLPGVSARSKYCYNFNVSHFGNSSDDYLVRAMFPSSDLTVKVHGNPLNLYGTRFYFTVDSTFVTTIDLDASKPQTVELVVSTLDESLYICLVPLEDRSSMPAISSLELRPLPTVYGERSSGQASNAGSNLETATSYLMTVSRQNFGGNVSLPAVRYPEDAFDRLWYPTHIPEEQSSEIKNSRSRIIEDLGYNYVLGHPPAEVYNTAWEGIDSLSKFEIKFDIKAARASRTVPTFYLKWFLFEVDPDENNENRLRYEDMILEHLGLNNEIKQFSTWAPGAIVERNIVQLWFQYKQTFFGDTALFRFQPNGSSEFPPMVNAVELYGEFEAVTQRTLQTEVVLIENFSTSFESSSSPVDAVGDPCLPCPWAWLVCSIEIPPRITQINLTSKGVKAKIAQEFGTLDRLTVLDLSNNSFYGSLPPTLAQVVTLRALNVAKNNLQGELPNFGKKSLKNLESISLRGNHFSGTLSTLVNALDVTATSLDVSHNFFTGSVPLEIKELTNLRSLDLSYNNLSGMLDSELFNLPELKNLNLENNDVEGKISDDIWRSGSKPVTVNLKNNLFTEVDLTSWSRYVLSNKRFDVYQQQVNLAGNKISSVVLPSQDLLNLLSKPSQPNSNPGFILLTESHWCKNALRDGIQNATLVQRYLCRSNEEEDFWEPSSENDGGVGTGTLVAIIVSSIVLILLMACIFALFLWRAYRRMKNLRQIQEALFKEDVRPPFYKYEELRAATGDFSQQNELGRGAFGAVYKAVLGDGSVVAVKRLFPTDQNLTDFLKEMVLITGIKHRHLVQLKGCCVKDKQRMLVYEYAENKNLAEALWGKERSLSLSWVQRLNICVGIARGLSYLHEELQPKIIHRDIKPQNILLDKYLNAKIADFGLARPMNEDVTHLATSVGGTLGYFSPEYATLGILTEKLDVYSYGVLVLEIISGRPSISFSSPEDEVYLQKWAVKMYKEDKLVNIAAEGLLAQSRGDEVTSVLKAALSCLQEDPERRPSMSHVVNMLTGNSEVALDIVKELRSGDQQRLFDELFNEATIGIINDKPEREDRALLSSMSSSSTAHPSVELSVMKPR